MKRSKRAVLAKNVSETNAATLPVQEAPQPLPVIEYAGQIIVKGWIPMNLDEE